MSKFNKSYRVRTEVGKDSQVHVNLDRDYDVLEIMSLKINQENAYKFHTSNYGVIAGRVLANDAFGIPNAKVSVFIPIDANDQNDVVKTVLYPYNNTKSQDENGVRYNLLTNEQINECHTIIGTFPEKQYLLDNDSVLEVFEKYYKFTTRTNNAGDYMIFGVPTGSQTLHVDIDLSDIGILSQKPRDMFYKGYNIESFDNPNKFKYDTNLDSLVQVISQDNITNVIPFWGDENESSIGITRCDINIQYKFEPTCVFMGSVVADTNSNGISKKCIPTPGMGSMEEIVTGSGTIEMIRKTPSGDVEEFQIKGNQLINGNGVWCYQIPMNLDYMMTDEFGNMVPTNHPEKGIPTRTRVRFRISLQDFDNDNTNIALGKVLIPHNPDIYSENCDDEVDYNFGTKTKEDSYRDLFWNGVYSVKSYIPRIQKGANWKNEKFTGFKRVNYYGDKNPIPYNNIRIKIPFAFTIMCVLIKSMIRMAGFLNWLFRICSASFYTVKDDDDEKKSGAFISISGELCNDNLDYLCIIPGINIVKIANSSKARRKSLLAGSILKHFEELGGTLRDMDAWVDDSTSVADSTSIDYLNREDNETKAQENKTGLYTSDYVEVESDEEGKGKRKQQNITMRGIRVTDKTDYLIQCIEMKLAQEYKVIQFDFYNDWINGLIYIPRWMRTITKKRTFLWGLIKWGGKVKACNENVQRNINIVQQCGLSYSDKTTENMQVINPIGCKKTKNNGKEKLYCHKSSKVRKKYRIFKSAGLVHTFQNMNNQNIYYFKPIDNSNDKCVRLFATDIVLLGTLNNCDKWGIPEDLTQLVSSTYQMPPNLALTDSDLEGNDYEVKLDATKYIYMEILANKGKAKKVLLNGCYVGINPFDEDANYTELSGIDWGYTGPLQAFNDTSKFYKPGGHFLGITCRNAETSIKSCVNLSRICEYGVWMSQRQELNIPNPNVTSSTSVNNVFLNYATVPSGMISKDEISDTNYRRLFASLNKNRLRVKTNKETGYPIYDFEYVNPTNFGGELYNRVTEKNDILNRFVDTVKEEHYYEYIDDDYFKRGNKETESITSETEIMRTGELSDSEYLKYRFGLHDSDFNNNNIVKTDSRTTRFLIKNSQDNSLSFPMYDNSFYFYFGLTSGNTALDEFKKTYYANCGKIDLFSQSNNLDVNLSGLTIEYDGLVDNQNYTGNGSISYKKLIINDSYFDEGNTLTVDLLNVNEEKIASYVATSSVGHMFNNLKAGTYIIRITNDNGTIQKEFSANVDRISFKIQVQATPFNKDVSKWSENNKFNDYDNRNELGGYLTIANNSIEYKKSATETELLDIFNDPTIVKYIIRNDNNAIEIIGNERSVTYNGINKTLTTNSDGEFMIPVPRENEIYYIEVYGNVYNNKPVEFVTNLTSTKLFITSSENYVNNGSVFNLFYNNVSFNEVLLPYINQSSEDELSNEGWWSIKADATNPYSRMKWEEEPSLLTRWNMKSALYMNVINDATKPHVIKITNYGGQAPYTIRLTGEDNDMSTSFTDNNLSKLEGILVPTINYRKDGNRRINFTYRATDNIGQALPEAKPFIIPVIYKPFFMEMLLCNYEEYGVFLCGNIYNGKTWEESEGFNNCTFNGQRLQPFTTTKPDTVIMLDEIDDNGNQVSNGGINYEGSWQKYNGRKITISRSISAFDIYGINNGGRTMSCEVNIGTSHTDNSVLYEDSTYVKNTKMCLYKFNLETQQVEGKYSFRMKIKDTDSDYTLYPIISSNDNSKGHYLYPFDTTNGEPSIANTKLFRNIINNTVESVFGANDYIQVNSDTLNGKNVYYVAIPKNEELSYSNDNSVLKSVTISRLIQVDTLKHFYPLELTYAIDDCNDVLNANGSFSTIITLKAADEASKNNINGKYFTIRFYRNKDDVIPSLTKSVQPNGNKELVMKLTLDERTKIGLTNDATTTTSHMTFHYDYDATIIESGITSPTAYEKREVRIKFTNNTSAS